MHKETFLIFDEDKSIIAVFIRRQINKLRYVAVTKYTLSKYLCWWLMHCIIKLCTLHCNIEHWRHEFQVLFCFRYISSIFFYLSDSWLVGFSIWTVQRHKSHPFSTFLAAHARSFGLPNLRTRYLFHKKTIIILDYYFLYQFLFQ